MQLGELLVRKKLISPEQLHQVLAIQDSTRCRLGELLIQQSLISTDALSMALREQYWRNNGYWVIG